MLFSDRGFFFGRNSLLPSCGSLEGDIKSKHSRFTWESRINIHSVLGLVERGECDVTVQERRVNSTVW